MRTLRMKPLEDTVSLTIEIPRGLYELAVRYQEELKDEPECETLNDYIVGAIESATEGDERIHQLKARRFVR
jgi:hypothetical protein